jgi:hypothetical protein
MNACCAIIDLGCQLLQSFHLRHEPDNDCDNGSSKTKDVFYQEVPASVESEEIEICELCDKELTSAIELDCGHVVDEECVARLSIGSPPSFTCSSGIIVDLSKSVARPDLNKINELFQFHARESSDICDVDIYKVNEKTVSDERVHFIYPFNAPQLYDFHLFLKAVAKIPIIDDTGGIVFLPNQVNIKLLHNVKGHTVVQGSVLEKYVPIMQELMQRVGGVQIEAEGIEQFQLAGGKSKSNEVAPDVRILTEASKRVVFIREKPITKEQMLFRQSLAAEKEAASCSILIYA